MKILIFDDNGNHEDKEVNVIPRKDDVICFNNCLNYIKDIVLYPTSQIISNKFNFDQYDALILIK
jgi:hypothetical protein